VIAGMAGRTRPERTHVPARSSRAFAAGSEARCGAPLAPGAPTSSFGWPKRPARTRTPHPVSSQVRPLRAETRLHWLSVSLLYRSWSMEVQADEGLPATARYGYLARRSSIIAMNVLSYGLPMILLHWVNILHPVPQ